MNAPTLSFVLTTRNKLPMLREVLRRLAEVRLPDEEIVVVDAASSDGTPEYLADLARRGMIQDWSTEPDRGEGHGFNKGILRSRGELIKLITDDDAFYWKGIADCRRFMLEHTEIDALFGDSCTTFAEDPDRTVHFDYFGRAFERWLSTRRPFDCGGLGLMIRRCSLPLVGLLHTGLVCVDQEYSLRASSVANLAWYSGMIARRIDNAASNYRVLNDRAASEARRVWEFYLGNPLNPRKLEESAAPISLAGRARRCCGTVARALGIRSSPPASADRPAASAAVDPEGLFRRCDRWLDQWHAEHESRILHRT